MTTPRVGTRMSLTAAIAACGGILFGYNTGVISGALPQIVKLWHLDPVADGLVASALLIGAVLGAALTGKLCDLLGRRDIIMANAGIFALGAFLSGQAPDIAWLIFGRILAGFAIGSVSLATPLYLAEISPTASRGRLISFFQLAITLGLLLSFIAGARFAANPEGWRDMFWAGAVVSLVFGVAVLFLPGSPCWMVEQNDEEEARAILARLGRHDPDAVIRECRRELENDLGDSWLDLFKPDVRPALFTGVALFFLQQFVGINAILYYAPMALKYAGIEKEADVSLAMLGIGAVNVASTLAAMLLVDKVGRKPLLNVGILGMVLSLAAMGIGEMAGARVLAAIATPIYIACFAMGLGTMGWLLIAEIYPLRIRGLAMSFPCVAHWAFNGLMTFLFPSLLHVAGFGAMTLAFAAVGVAAWFFCRRFVPETRGRSFLEIRQEWIDRARRSGASNLLYQLIASVAATGGLLFGLNFGIVAGALLLIKTQWSLSPAQQGLVVSSITAGAAVGALLSGKASDRFGRRYLLMGMAAVFVVGAFGCGLAPGLEWLLAARFLTGVAVGVVGLTVPLYLSEIAPPSIRGGLVSVNHLALVTGVLLSYLINAVFAVDIEGWRSMFMVCAVPAVALGVGMLFLPESPRWMVVSGRLGGARRMLKRLSVDEPEREVRAIQASLNVQETGSWTELLRPSLRPPLLIGLAMVFFSQCTGVGAVVYYAPTIFRQIGFDSPLAAMFPAVGLGVVNLAMTAVSIHFVDRIGRRVLFVIGLVGVILTLGVIGAVLMAPASGEAVVRWVVVGSLVAYMACYALSLGAVCGLIVSEIFPLKIRGVAMSVVFTANYLFDLVVAQTFPSIVHAMGLSLTFWMYGLIAMTGLFFWRSYLPETRNRSLEEIEEHWSKRLHPRLMR